VMIATVERTAAMHVERAVSNFAILIVGSLVALVAFLSTRLNHVVFYVLVAACLVMAVVLASSAKKNLTRIFPGLMGETIVPRWNMKVRTVTHPIATYRMKARRQQTLIPAQPQRANAA
jgi:hypothetical protein